MQTLDVPMRESNLRKPALAAVFARTTLYLFAPARIVCAGTADCSRGVVTAAFRSPDFCSCENVYFEGDAQYAY